MVKNLRLTEEILMIDLATTKDLILDFIRNQTAKAKATGTVIGLSGGVDSALCAKLCVSALKVDHVFGLIIPSTTSSQEDINDAKFFAERLGIDYEVINISQIEDTFTRMCQHYDPSSIISNANLLPRIRMIILYYHANLLNRIVVGTGNKSERLIGYYTKYGDGGVDILPIGDLYKTQVRYFSEYLKIPEKIVRKVPTAGLWRDQTDEDEIGVKYSLLDLILYGLFELKMRPENVAEATGAPLKTVNKILEMNRRSEHKRDIPPIIKIQKPRW